MRSSIYEEKRFEGESMFDIYQDIHKFLKKNEGGISVLGLKEGSGYVKLTWKVNV